MKNHELPPIVVLSILLLCITAFPIYQFITFGVIFYANALDESNYLQYHTSLLAARLMVRPVQGLVNGLHEAGLSGGLIHLIFDAIFPLLCLLLVRFSFRAAGLFSGREWISAFSLVTFPLLFNAFNPLVAVLRDYSLENQWLYWLTLPDAAFPPVVRTPEPQFSWAIVGVTALISLRLQTPWTLLLALPVLYTFIAIPIAFVSAALCMATIFGRRGALKWLVPIASFVAISLFLRGYFELIVEDKAKGNILASHLPLISYSGTLTLILFACVYKRLADTERWILGLIALSPWVAANTQIISGLVTAPSNFEQYYGVCVAALLLLLVVDRLLVAKAIWSYAALTLFVLFNIGVFIEHTYYLKMLPPSEALLRHLQRDASAVVINHPKISVLYNQVYPMQQPTFLSYSKVYWGQAKEMLPEYLCVKQDIMRDPERAAAFVNTLGRFDAALKNETEDDPFISLFRRKFSTPRFEVDAIPANCPTKERYYYIVRQIER